MGRWTDVFVRNRWIDGWIEGWMDRWMEGGIHL